jgi:hypothetical protein
MRISPPQPAYRRIVLFGPWDSPPRITPHGGRRALSSAIYQCSIYYFHYCHNSEWMAECPRDGWQGNHYLSGGVCMSGSCSIRVCSVRLLLRAALVLGAISAAVIAHAEFRYRQANLAELVRRSDLILQGRVSEVTKGSLPNYPHVADLGVTLEVEHALRGNAGHTYTFHEVLIPAWSNRGKQPYNVGDRLLLFLHVPSEYGLSRPLGDEQGRFHIFKGVEGRTLIENEFANAGLFRGVENDATQAGIELSRPQADIVSRRHGAVSLEDFTSLVRSLLPLPRLP